ncbi:MAG: alpha/beta fold hydrolase [Steroidobacteraceae bacterium]
MDLFPGFGAHRIKTGGGEIFARMGGAGPALLLLHGYPQTHACWHKIAGRLAERLRIVACDLPGYGESASPCNERSASKHSMARSLEAMRTLGFERFHVAGHDRGARAAYRLALDHPDRVMRLGVLGVLPTFATFWKPRCWRPANSLSQMLMELCGWIRALHRNAAASGWLYFWQTKCGNRVTILLIRKEPLTIADGPLSP